jgi:toxin FitB
MTAQISYLLDTNVISEMMRPVPAARVVGFLDSIADQGLGLASITVWEILNGVGRLPAGRRRDELQTRFRGIVQTYFEDRVLDWSVGDAEACARLMERKRRSGEPLDDHLPDAMLAGLAVNRNLTIVTRNESEFRNTGARIANSWAAM